MNTEINILKLKFNLLYDFVHDVLAPYYSFNKEHIKFIEIVKSTEIETTIGDKANDQENGDDDNTTDVEAEQQTRVLNEVISTSTATNESDNVELNLSAVETTTPLIRTTTKIQKIAPIDLTRAVKVYVSQVQACQDMIGASATNLSKALKNKTLFRDHYWKYVEEGQDDENMVVNFEPAETQNNAGKRDFIAILDKGKSCIQNVFATQEELAKHFKLSKGTVFKYVTGDVAYNGMYFMRWQDVEPPLKEAYIARHGRPCVVETRDVICKYYVGKDGALQLMDEYLTQDIAARANNMNPNTIRKYAVNGTVMSGFCWRKERKEVQRFAE